MNASRDLNHLEPLVKQNVELFLDYCTKLGYKIKVSEAYRTKARQDYLYAQGRTRPGTIVTNAQGMSMSSYHQWGLAVDIYQDVRGAEYEQGFLEQIGILAESFGFEWGGRWKNFKDTAHLQMTFGLSIEQLKCGKKITDNFSRQYIDAIQKLVRKGEISQPGLWYRRDAITMKNIESLMIKFATKV